jgi:tetratricopeptide (TPR) repeat protein
MKKIISLVAVFLYVGMVSVKAQDKQVPPAPYGLSPVEAYSVFSESYKNKDYQNALPYGRWLLVAHPKKIQGLPQYSGDDIFGDMIDIYEGIAKKQSDPTLKTAYLDSAAALYNTAINTFSKDEIDHYDWYMQQGRFYQEHNDFINNGMQKAVEDYQKLFDMDPKKTTQIGQGYYVQVIVNNLVGQGEKDKALSVMKTAEPYANDKTKDYFEKIRNQLFSSPQERITYLKGKVKSDPKDVKSLKELFDLYHQTDNYDAAKQVAEDLYKLNPNYDNSERLGSIATDNANYKAAIKYYKEALDKAKTTEQKKTVIKGLVSNYINLEELQTARRYAREGIRLDSHWGEPYIQIARIYAQAVNDCTTGQMTRKDKVVYWLVLDYLDKAKRVDPSTANKVNQLYQTYKQVVPSVEEKFYQNWKKGEKIKVDSSLKKCYGWIDETTTVR